MKEPYTGMGGKVMPGAVVYLSEVPKASDESKYAKQCSVF